MENVTCTVLRCHQISHVHQVHLDIIDKETWNLPDHTQEPASHRRFS